MSAKQSVLVLCTGNSARSIVGEVLLRDLGAGDVLAYSAGSRPAGRVNPNARALLSAKGHDTGGLSSKSWDQIVQDGIPVDLVITVCASAAGETCPIFSGAAHRVHWGLPDPAALAEPDQPAAFKAVYAALYPAAQALVADIRKGVRGEALARAAARLAPRDIVL